MINKKIDALLKVIKRKYNSLEEPNFALINETFSANPYLSLVNKLKEIFVLEDVTDINDDVSFHYVLSTSEKQWVIELSMVGPYAIILKILDDVTLELVTPDTSIEDERKMISLLLENQIEILDREVLEQPCSLKLFNTEPENVSIYQALFTDTDVLPWKRGNVR